jgi:hypothetical protein
VDLELPVFTSDPDQNFSKNLGLRIWQNTLVRRVIGYTRLRLTSKLCCRIPCSVQARIPVPSKYDLKSTGKVLILQNRICKSVYRYGIQEPQCSSSFSQFAEETFLHRKNPPNYIRNKLLNSISLLGRENWMLCIRHREDLVNLRR